MTCSACGSEEAIQKDTGKHIGEYCTVCGKWLRWVPGNWRDFVWPVGAKYKGKTLAYILFNDRKYLEWAAENMTGNLTLKKRAMEALESTGKSVVNNEQEDAFDHISRHTDITLRDMPF